MRLPSGHQNFFLCRFTSCTCCEHSYVGSNCFLSVFFYSNCFFRKGNEDFLKKSATGVGAPPALSQQFVYENSATVSKKTIASALIAISKKASKNTRKCGKSTRRKGDVPRQMSLAGIAQRRYAMIARRVATAAPDCLSFMIPRHSRRRRVRRLLLQVAPDVLDRLDRVRSKAQG